MALEKWIKWAILEAACKTSTKLLQKSVGLASINLSSTLIATGIISLIQVAASILMNPRCLQAKFKQIIAACCFGAMAFIMTVLGFMVFLFNGDAGTSTFIMSLSVVPSTAIDVVFFKQQFTKKQLLGLVIAISSGFVILDCPLSLKQIAQMPLWIWLSIIMMFCYSINQSITLVIKDMHPIAKNFWGALISLGLVILGLIAFHQFGCSIEWQLLPSKFYWMNFIIGLIVVVMWSAGAISCQQGAKSVAIKTFIVNATYLSLVIVGGAMLFVEEQLTWFKITGIGLYLVSFVLIKVED